MFGWIGRVFRREKEEPLLAVLRSNGRGIYKRIDKNRELLELLYREVPGFVEENDWIVNWLKSQDDFLTALEAAADGRGGVVNHYTMLPRPWPTLESSRPIQGQFDFSRRRLKPAELVSDGS